MDCSYCRKGGHNVYRTVIQAVQSGSTILRELLIQQLRNRLQVFVADGKELIRAL